MADWPESFYQCPGPLPHGRVKSILDEKEIMMESLIAIKRAGADAILTYFALEAAEWIKSRD